MNADEGRRLIADAMKSSIEMYADKSTDELTLLAVNLDVLKDADDLGELLPKLPQSALKTLVALAWFQVTYIAASRKIADLQAMEN